MRKIWILVLPLLIFLLSFNTAFAEDLSPTPTSQSNYELPYPGLLPDSPLYFFRVIRDRIVSLLISDPLKKAEFDLLQADKRLNAGVYLFNSSKKNDKNMELAISTISKAENYFENATQKLKEAKKEGRDILEMGNRLMESSIKHQEVLSLLKERSPKNFKTKFDMEAKRVAGFETEVKSLIPKM
ncbi:MAG: DUF5667 domain-containing protein [bacterium]|nr:DUF5667 domain-containing protein [bacterium]